MNKNYFAPLALAFALMVGCQAEAELAPSVEAPEATDSKIVLEASASVPTKVAYAQGEGAINATWESDDAFSVYDATGAYVGDFTYTGTAGSATGTFTQDGDFTMEDGTYTAVIPASTAATLAERITWTTSNQTNNVSASSLDHLSAAVRLSAEFDYSSQSTSLTFAHEVSLLKLVVTLPEATYISTISVADGDNSYYLYFNNEGIMDSSFTTYMAVEPTDGTERDITFTFMGEGYYTITKTSSVAFAAGSFYPATLDFTASDDTDSDVIDYYETGWTAPNGVTYSKETEGVKLLTESTTITSTAGVYFLDPASDNVEFTLAVGTYTNSIVIGRYANSQPKVNAAGIISFGEGEGVFLKNLDFTGNPENYTFNYSTGGVGYMNYWVFEDCWISTNTEGLNTSSNAKSFSYFSNASGSLENIIFENNIIEVNTDTNSKATRIINFSKTASNVKYIKVENNVLYVTSNYYTNGALVFIGSETPDLEVYVDNNTCVNYACSSVGFINAKSLSKVTLTDNIFWANDDMTATYTFKYTSMTDAPEEIVSGNAFYGGANGSIWKKYPTASTYINKEYDDSCTISSDVIYFIIESTDPLATCDYASGIFTQAEGYEQKGATIAWQQ